MVKNKLTEKIMTKVVSFEKKRTTSWLEKFGVALAFLVVAGGVFFFGALRQILEEQTLEFISIVLQDSETIVDNWKDNGEMIWEELPRVELVLFVFSLALLIIVVITLRGKFALMRRRFLSLRRFPK